ncbi:transposase [Patescibacteria group bacterium]|nr:transposase [Patescibacteria group bacterium]
MKKYKCPICTCTDAVVRFGRRKKVLRYFCKRCAKHFSINPCFLDTKAMLSDHLDGLSFRVLGRKYRMSPMRAWRICEEELKKLPDNNQFTFRYCSQFSTTFVFDGKYFPVASQEYDWVLLWGVDYFRHDMPIIFVAPAESYHTWSKFFFYFRIIGHYPQLLVCDDNTNLKLAARKHFPAVHIQTCFNHFKENIRRDLKVRSIDTYKPFMHRIEDVLTEKLSDDAMNRQLFSLYRDFKDDPVTLSVLTNIQRYREELTGYRGIPGSPVTTNMIEGLNSHLEARLQALRSFQSISYAKLWLNGYVLKRRYTTYTDCKGKFRSVNGKSGVELTKKPEVDLPPLF